MANQPSDMLAGKYRIEAVIGHGAFGRVYRARDVMLDRLVAVKELDRGAADLGSSVYGDYVRRFQREAMIQARFNHPNIVHVYELIETAPGTPYLVMEHVDGGSLKELLERHRALPINRVLIVARQVLAGLAAVHADPRDIVHRDIKPSNVLLTPDGQAKLSDFGLAQIGDESGRSTLGQSHPGTALYMSPEQETTNVYLQPASDLFSFGCVLFELLTGVPYKSARRHKQDLRSLRPDVPAWLETAASQAVARDLDERPESAEISAGLLHDGVHKAKQGAKAAKPARRAAEPKALTEAEPRHQVEEQPRRVGEERARQAAETKGRAKAEKRRQAEERRRPEAEAQAEANIEWVDIPAGKFLYGDDHKPVTIRKAYQIGRSPVTNAQYQRFLAAKYKQPGPAGWDQSARARQADHPVVDVSWDDAQAYCQWAKCRLPTEAEWEKAARGTDGQKYPWGNEAPDASRCNFNRNVKATTPVGQYSPTGDSPYGCVDMAGNVWEWTASKYDEKAYVLRGGSWFHEAQIVRASCRIRDAPGRRRNDSGFRCAR